MAFEPDNELLQDFLVEAGELLDALDSQLISLEQAPSDRDLLNAIFRAFHTIKGGAGFLEVTPLVEVCHEAEDVFNLLRNGELTVNADIMDVMLKVLDVLNRMFDQLRSGQLPEPADPALVQAISDLAQPGGAPAPAEPVAAEPAVTEPQAVAPEAVDDVNSDFEQMLSELGAAEEATASATDEPAAGASGDDLITDDEFDALLDKLHGKGKFAAPATDEPKVKAAPAAAASDEITDDEFEKVLDELHGKGKGPTAASNSDEITDDEFEKVLDELHGKGKGPTAAQPEAPAAPPASKPAPAAPRSGPADAKANKAASAKPAGGEQAKGGESTVRVDTERLDTIMNLVGELVLVRNRMNTLKATFENEQVAQVIATLDMVTSDLQGAVMKTRMQPVKKVFGRFPRVVRDTARSLGKQVDLVLEGEETDLDKNLVEALADPLVHLVRNAVDHGIEMPDVRESNGKPANGTVVLSAAQEGDHIQLSIRDDGAGMDPEVLRRKGVEKGLVDPDAADRMTDQECFELILMPGFSTKEQISDISGRGVGMDVVKTAITKLSGLINIDSELGVGSVINIKVPLTLAILPTLMVVVSGRKYAIPLGIVNEIFEMADREVNVVDGQMTVTVRDRALPLYRLNDWLKLRGETVRPRSSNDQVVLVQVGAQLLALTVDSVIGQEEVVIKPLGDLLRSVEGFAGATITGDGHIALILDLPGLLRRWGGRSRSRLRVVA